MLTIFPEISKKCNYYIILTFECLGLLQNYKLFLEFQQEIKMWNCATSKYAY